MGDYVTNRKSQKESWGGEGYITDGKSQKEGQG